MKTRQFVQLVILFLVILVMSFMQSNYSKYYYAYNEKIGLNKLDNKLIIRYKQNKQSDLVNVSLFSDLIDKPIDWKDDSTLVVTIEGGEMLLLKNKIPIQSDVKSCNPVYSINTGLEMGVTDEFLVKFKETVSPKEIENINNKYDAEVVKTTDIYDLIKVPPGKDALEIANEYQESGLTHFSHPNFIVNIELHQNIPNDTYFNNQFSFHNTGQIFTDAHSGTIDADIDAPEAWTMTTGSNNIIIAVLDQGLTPNHPDLPNQRQVRLNGSNFADGDPNNPSPVENDNHGNACAGTIAATQNNNEGISGIAPNCRIMPIRILSTYSQITPQEIADAIEFAWQNGAHIISNSWGYRTPDPNFLPVIRNAIIAATSQGRNGLGCVVSFSSGNTANLFIGNNGYIGFPSNVNVNGVLTVGASDRDDLQANYSPTSDPESENNQIIDIVAPSHRAYSCQIPGETFEAWAIDMPNNPGYNPVHDNDCGPLPGIGTILPNNGMNYLSYTGRFGGTSYSCPQVAGVASLILTIDPNLTQFEVFNIIMSAADQVHADIYEYNNGFCNELGHGRLNAYRAVFLAYDKIINITGPEGPLCSSNTTYYLEDYPSYNDEIIWSSSNNITIVNDQGTNITIEAKPNSSSLGWIKALIISEDNDTLEIQKDLWVGVPYINPATIQFECVEGPGYFCTNAFGNEFSFTYDYPYNYFDIKLTNLSETQTLTQFRIFSTWGTMDCSPPDGTYLFQVRGNNDCGTATNWTKKAVDFVDCGMGGLFSLDIYPNPATEQATITIVSTEDKDAITKKVDEEWQLEVYTQGQLLKHSVPAIIDNKYVLNTSGWKPGMYFIRAYYKDEVVFGTLVVNK